MVQASGGEGALFREFAFPNAFEEELPSFQPQSIRARLRRHKSVVQNRMIEDLCIKALRVTYSLVPLPTRSFFSTALC